MKEIIAQYIQNRKLFKLVSKLKTKQNPEFEGNFKICELGLQITLCLHLLPPVFVGAANCRQSESKSHVSPSLLQSIHHPCLTPNRGACPSSV